MKKASIIGFVFLLQSLHIFSQVQMQTEIGVCKPQYNDVRIPGTGGTLFSLTDDLTTKSKLVYRLRLGYTYQKHHISVLFAPLHFVSNGRFMQNVNFMNTSFNANTLTKGVYTFNSYRATYSYKIVNNTHFAFALGLTGKIRDAEIKLTAENNTASRTDLGFVPLIHLDIKYRINRMQIHLAGDALAAKQGRAEDFKLSANYQLNQHIDIYCGYRVLEGGSDGSVYTFAWFNYYIMGITITFNNNKIN